MFCTKEITLEKNKYKRKKKYNLAAKKLSSSVLADAQKCDSTRVNHATTVNFSSLVQI